MLFKRATVGFVVWVSEAVVTGLNRLFQFLGLWEVERWGVLWDLQSSLKRPDLLMNIVRAFILSVFFIILERERWFLPILAIRDCLAR